MDVNGFQTFQTFLTRRDLHGRSQSRGCLLSGALQFFLKFVESNLSSIIKELANKAEPIHHIHLLHVPWLRLGACPLSSLHRLFIGNSSCLAFAAFLRPSHRNLHL